MKTVTVKSFITKGINAIPVTITTSVTDGIGIHIVGVQDISVKEILLRVCTALESAGYKVPGKKIVVDIRPADNKMVTDCASNLDLPVAISIIAASEQKLIATKHFQEYALVGELGLNGDIREVKSEYTISLAADKIIIPLVNAARLRHMPGIEDQHKVFVASNLEEAFHIFRDPEMFDINNAPLHDNQDKPEKNDADFKYVQGGHNIRRALEIAAAGGHSINLIGGENVNYLIKCFHSILPAMSREEFIEKEKIYEAAWKQTDGLPVRPVRMPHYNSSIIPIIGGGFKTMPGEVSLAHNGILVLDEFNEWPQTVIEAIRTVKSAGVVKISRLNSAIEYPAKFILVGKSKACPCGKPLYKCTCDARTRENALRSLSDKSKGLFDITHWVGEMSIQTEQINVSSEEIRIRVERARKIQTERYEGTDIRTNADLKPSQIKLFCKMSDANEKELQRLTSAPGHFGPECIARIKKVARTIADLDDSENIESTHIIEALNYFPLN